MCLKVPERKRKIMLSICQIYMSRNEKEKSIHQCVWEAHFAAVNDAIADGFDEHEDVMVLWVEDYPLDCGFESLESVHFEFIDGI